MQLLGDHQRLPTKQRTGLEKAFKQINTIVLAVQLACILVDLSNVIISADKTFTGSMWVPEPFGLESVLHHKTANCSYVVTERVRGFADTTINITAANHARLFADVAINARFTLIIAMVAFVVGVVNKFLYDFNIFEFKFGRVIFHKEIVTLAELMLLCMTFNGASNTEVAAALVRKYLEKGCGVVGHGTLPFASPFVAIYVSTAFVLLIHFITFLLHLRFTLNDKQPNPSKK